MLSLYLCTVVCLSYVTLALPVFRLRAIERTDLVIETGIRKQGFWSIGTSLLLVIIKKNAIVIEETFKLFCRLQF